MQAASAERLLLQLKAVPSAALADDLTGGIFLDEVRTAPEAACVNRVTR
jgi:hypothetical protein